jgi:acetyl esterase
MTDLPLDADLAKIIPLLPLRDVPTMTPDSVRQSMVALAQSRSDAPLPMPASVIDATLAGPAGPIAVRVYRPHRRPSPTVVYFHGGGWVAGDLTTHDRTARLLAVDTESVVISVDYRRPPEAKFPAAFDDALAVTRAVAARIDDYGGQLQRLGVAGDSAGGNLAAAVAIACRDAGAPRLAAQLLIYPVIDVAAGFTVDSINRLYPSRASNAEGYFLTLAVMQWFSAHYLPAGSSLDRDPRASPIHAASLSGVAPTVLCTAHFDPLRDEGKAYADKLRAADVPVDEHFGAGMIHGYFGMGNASPAAAAEANRVRADFKRRLDAQ